MYAITPPTPGDWGKNDGNEEAPQSTHLDTGKKRLDLLWYIDNKEEMRLQILPVTNIQPLDFETKTAF